MKAVGRIALLFPSASFDSIPCVRALLQGLSREGSTVDVYCMGNKKYMVQNEEYLPGINIFYSPNLLSIKRNMLLRFLPSPILYTILNVKFFLKQYDLVIGSDPTGLIAGWFFTRFIRKPLIYLSLEVMAEDQLGSLKNKCLKKLERVAHKATHATIGLDAERIKLLARSNAMSFKSMILPNADLGFAKKQKTDFLRKKFNLQSSDTVILQVGTLGGYTLSKEVSQQMSFWPKDWKLVFHTKRIEGSGDWYVDELESIDAHAEGRLILSLDPVESGLLDELVSSADIGLALYEPFNKNVAYMGLSSGKIGSYLRAGLPVIATNLPSLRSYFSEYQCGILVDKVEDVQEAISRIVDDYDSFSKGAIKCYNELWSADLYIPKIINEIRSCLGVA